VHDITPPGLGFSEGIAIDPFAERDVRASHGVSPRHHHFLQGGFAPKLQWKRLLFNKTNVKKYSKGADVEYADSMTLGKALEESGDVLRLELAGFGLLHLLFEGEEALLVHHRPSSVLRRSRSVARTSASR
jgi:hypothetical protein